MRHCLLIISFLLASIGFTFADENKKTISVDNITISDLWARATPANAKAGAGYMIIENKGEVEDVLISVESAVSDKTEIHTMAMTDGVMTMRHVDSGVVIPAGEKVAFKPGGFHIMFMGLKAPLKEGEAVPVTLNFANGASIETDMSVAGLGAQMAPSHKH